MPRQADPPAFHRIEGPPHSGVLIVCDHASSVIPARLGDLGLPGAALADHIAWDIGAGEVTRLLARRLGCPAVLAGVSRLVIDCNRRPGDSTSIPAASGGTEIPGNRDVGEAEAAARAEAWFHPYHQEIAAVLGHLRRHGPPPAMVSVHSFTPLFDGAARPWHVGVLSNRDRRMAEPLIRAFESAGGLIVGDNQPYSGREINYTLDTHAGAAGLPHVSVEIRQDLIADTAGAERWAALLERTLRPILVDPAVRYEEAVKPPTSWPRRVG